MNSLHPVQPVTVPSPAMVRVGAACSRATEVDTAWVEMVLRTNQSVSVSGRSGSTISLSRSVTVTESVASVRVSPLSVQLGRPSNS